MVNRAAPPGSMRYFSVLYAPAEKRDAVLALYVVDAEIRESAQSANHDVAHTRLEWWRAEVDRLVNGAPRHPAMRVLDAVARDRRTDLMQLHELIAAADMDLARMTYANVNELRAYCARSGGTIVELIASQLVAPEMLNESERLFARRVGVGVRQVEMVRDLRQDAYDGRLYLPLDEMDARTITTAHVREAEGDARVRDALRSWRARIQDDLQPRREMNDARLRPLHVLAALHRRLLDRIAARNYDVGAERIELGPVEKPWIAWRAARRTGG